MPWATVEEILDRALDLPPDDRPSFLDRACAGDEPLRREVESLLAIEGAAEGFLAEPVFSLHGLAASDSGDPNLGRVVGAYRLLRPLGRGGMGAVYLAERCDGQFEQTVAVKLIKRGMDTDEILRRFRNERQILAGLVHEHVARVYDGGTTDDGLPFFVMEHVEGEPIDRWCDARRLPVTERLRLFHAVCRAVQAAHQNLVVHRDLKPANILITGDGAPKLLDFGIAKLLAPEGGAGDGGPGAPTELGWRPLTPGYASPEQLRGEPVTTASDVYSLGVLLYELLTGRLPHQAPTGQPPPVWERLIAGEEPIRPSLAVRRAFELRQPGGESAAVTPAEVADARGTDPRRLERRLAGDLDTIVLTALAPERDRRYASAEQLAEDVRRHLEGLPVRARTPTAAYRLGKFVRRNAWGTAVAAGAAIFLVVFAVTMAVQRERIAAERDRAEAVTGYMVELFEEADPSQARGEEVTVREALELGVERLDSLRDQPVIRADLLDAIGRVDYSLALYDDAEPLLEEALELRRRELGPDHPDVAETLQSLAHVRMRSGETEGVEAMLRDALAITRHDDSAGIAYPHALHNLGSYLLEVGGGPGADPAAVEAEALALLGQALDLKVRRLGPDDPDVAFTLAVLGQNDRRLGDLTSAEERFRRVLAIRRAEYGDRDHPELATAVNNLAVTLDDADKLEEARTLYEESVEMRRNLFGERDPRYAVGLNNLAFALQATGEPAAAVELFQEALAILREALGEGHGNVLTARRNLAAAHAAAGDPVSCESEAHAALAALGEPPPAPLWRRADIESVLGACLAALGRPEEAEPLLAGAVPALTEGLGPEGRQTVEARGRLEAFRAARSSGLPVGEGGSR